MSEESDSTNFIVELVVQSFKQKDATVAQAVNMAVNYYFQRTNSNQIEKESDFFEQFLIRFKKLKIYVKDNPARIEILELNSKDLVFEDIVIRLMYALSRIKKIEQHHTGRIAVVPDSYKKAWQMCQRYAPFIEKSACKILKRYFDITIDFAKKIEVEVPDWFKKSPDRIDLSPLKPSLSGIFNVACYIEDASDWDVMMEWKQELDEGFAGLKYFENCILCCGIEEMHDRYMKAPVLLIPTFINVKNPEALYRLYEEIVRTYAGKNYLACLSLCRAFLEYLLNNYYECKKFDNLSNKIEEAEKKYFKLRRYKLQKNKKSADDILHNYSGKKIEETTVLNFIKALKWLVDDIPSKN